MGSAEEESGEKGCSSDEPLASPASLEGSVGDGSSEDAELLRHILCHMDTNPGRSKSAGEDSEEEVCDVLDSLASLV